MYYSIGEQSGAWNLSAVSEVVRLSESPLLEVSLYVFRK